MSLDQTKPQHQAHPKPLVFSIGLAMNDQMRRERLLALVEREFGGDKGRLTRVLTSRGMTKGRVSQLFDERQPFGERAAENLARKLGKVADYFTYPSFEDRGSSASEPPAFYRASPQGQGGRLKVTEVLRAAPDGRLMSHESGAALGFVELFELAPGAVAFRVRGDGLAPAIEDGEFLIVTPGAGCSPGQKIILELVDGSRLCKRLLFQRDDAVVVSDLASRQQATLQASEVRTMSPVRAVYSADHWRPPTDA